MQLIEAFVHNPVKVSVGVLLFVLFGFIGLLRMPMQLTPEVQIPTITIETRWLGASPQEIEREIVQEQEEQLKGVEGVVKMSSECLNSTGRIDRSSTISTPLSAHASGARRARPRGTPKIRISNSALMRQLPTFGLTHRFIAPCPYQHTR